MRAILHTQWRIAECCDIVSQRFGDQYAVYHRGSGDTHLLDYAGIFLLNEIKARTSSFSQLLGKLSAEFEFESAEQPQQYLHAWLAEFQKLSIIERLDT